MPNTASPQQSNTLAFSRKGKSFFTMPGGTAFGNRIQRLSNQRTNRHLSRISITPEVTPIWQQRTFVPSPELQQRFGPKDQEIQTDKQQIQVPISTSPTTQQPQPSTQPGQTEQPNSPPVEQAKSLPVQDKEMAAETPTSQPHPIQPVPDVPMEDNSKEETLTSPTPSIDLNSQSQTTSSQPSHVAQTPLPVTKPIEILSKSTEEPTNTPVPTQTEQQNIDQASTDLSNTDIVHSIDTLTQIREQILEQEKKLHSIQQGLPTQNEGQYLADLKTKEALINNLDHALSNTQSELNKLRNEEGVSNEMLLKLEEQLKKQKDSVTHLQHEKKKLKEKYEALKSKTHEQEHVTQNIDTLQQQEQLLKKVKNQQAIADEPILDPSVRDLINETMSIETQKPQIETPEQPKPQPLQLSKDDGAVSHMIKMPAITTEPNAINGIVLNAAGKLITDAVVIIKNEEQRPLRALKTNELGQFWITTSLENGRYFIETEKEGFRFDTIEIELNNNIVDPIIVKAKTS